MELLELTVPLLLAGGGSFGPLAPVDVYDALLSGAADGLGVLIRIVPALIALLTAVWMLRASGAPGALGGTACPAAGELGQSPRRRWRSCWCGR